MAAGLAVADSGSFHPNQDHIFDLPTNLSLQTLITWEGNVLVCVQKGEKENRGWKQWVEGDKLHLVSPRVCPGPFCACTNRPFTQLGALIKKNGPTLFPEAPAKCLWSCGQKAVPIWLRRLQEESYTAVSVNCCNY